MRSETRSRRATLVVTLLCLLIPSASLLAQAMELTNARSAGLLLGVWGLGFQLGRALASLFGAGLVDLHQDGIAVTVEAQFAELLRLAG